MTTEQDTSYIVSTVTTKLTANETTSGSFGEKLAVYGNTLVVRFCI